MASVKQIRVLIDINKFVNIAHIYEEPPNAENTPSGNVMAYLKHLSLEKISFHCIDV